MNNFQISPKLGNNAFLVRCSELEGRLDPTFYATMPKVDNLVSLHKIATIHGGKRIPKNKGFSTLSTQYKYLRVDNFNEEYINISSLKSISAEVFGILSRYEAKDNDLIISIAGTIGKCIILKNDTDNKIILTENAARISLKSSSITAEALRIILQTSLLQKQIKAQSIQTTIPKLGLDKILSLKIPVPSQKIQAKIIAIMDSAYEAKRQKEAEAQRLLDSIDEYLLGELGIELPAQGENTVQSRIFMRQLSEISGGRFDPFFNSLNNQGRSGKYEFYDLKKLAYLRKGDSITSNDIVEGDFPVIAGGQTSPYTHNVANNNGDIITVSASGAYSGYVWYHRDPVFASDCTMISSMDAGKLSTLFLAEYLKSAQQDIYNLQKGSGQPHVYPSDLEKIQIPLPPIKKQEKITVRITGIRNQAKQLQQDAKLVLEEAKKEVEKLILGGGK